MASGISSTTSGTATGAATKTASQELAGNFTQFLTLLTTQLKNQNPLDPMDTNQFTQQLVQYAGVEQQLKSNDRLDSILSNAKSSSAASATGFIGQTITADGRTTALKSGAASWTLTPARAATQARITISDAKGNVVATQTKALAAVRVRGSISMASSAPGSKGKRARIWATRSRSAWGSMIVGVPPPKCTWRTRGGLSRRAETRSISRRRTET
jgi:flagellar hook assembly protein FlgD